MAVTMKLSYIDDLGGGRKRFRRRWPTDVIKVRGEEHFQKPLKARSGLAMVTERETILAEFEAIVAAHRRSQEERESMSPRARWKEAQQEADRLLKGSRGGDEVVRQVLAEDIAQRQGDPMLYRAVVQPDAAPPAYTLADAFEFYKREKIDENQGRGPKNRLTRVRKKTEEALGKLSKLPMADLRRQHGRKLLDHLQSSKTSTGRPLSVGTIRRELDLVRALTEFALVEFDLINEVNNPFRKLEVRQTGDEAPTVDRNARLPLPEEVVAKVRERLSRSKRPELLLIWRLLEGTGCRSSEISGLRLEDVKVDHPTPHIHVTWHEDRRIKTKASHRLVPLAGDALKAAQEAVKLAEGEALLFRHYAGEGGAERLSAALNKHVRAVTDDRRHVVYSLRHNFKDKLIEAGADPRIEHRIMGHAAGNLGDRVYGSEDAWLKVAAEVVRDAVQAP
ncbi:tyrosine-type recombinase/integrase [Pseudohalocynthiibacter aestuariivivens]|nr:site-specific integrase [Pseudohalocynthiibacter aestuariivivens]QIE45325.1 tyrosine-type recombinase/integrase [Pseudohalocynthiibacter aestuariivivens]